METTYETRAAMRAARGAAMLDQTMPGWADRIDLDFLDMSDAKNCIVGQLFATSGGCCGWCDGIHALFDVSSYVDAAGLTPFDYGFQGDEHVRYAELTPAWTAEVKARTA